MATEWYLMNTNHDTISGFENDDFNNFAKDAFNELAETAASEKVEICNYDLTERIEVNVIINGKLQDTKLNSLQRQMLSPVGTCKAGQYVYYKNRYWLIIGLVDGNNVYDKCVMILCNYLLTWINGNGKIIQRWASISSASQYNNGETSTAFYFVKSDQLMVLTPDDDECLLMKHKQRFIIDRRCEVYEKNYTRSGTVIKTTPLNVYELTRMDNVLYDYQDSGYSEFMAYQSEQQENDGYHIIDGKGYWVCETQEIEESEDVLPMSCKIIGDNFDIYCGIEPGTFYPLFTDASGNVVTDVEPIWEVDSAFPDKLRVEYVENAICISADDDKLINNSFELSLSADGYEKSTVIVMIKAFI